MRFLRLVLILIFVPAGLFSQLSPLDTIPVSDTILLKTGVLKSAGELTVETRVDSVYTLVINELLASNSGSYLDNYGDDDDWFEIYNYGDDPVWLDLLYFTDDPAEPYKWKMDSIVELDPVGHLVIWADAEPEEGYNHASFRLSAEGEYLAIYAEDGSLIDQRYFGAQTTNVSYGRFPDAGLIWNYFSVPTPGEANTSPGAGTILPAPTSNLTGGFYTAPVELALYSSASGASIYYTTDCTIPDSTDLLYQAPVEINNTTIVRATLIREGAIAGPVITISILMDETEYENPVVSLVAEPTVLFGNNGIISANNSILEASAHLEYIEDGDVQFGAGTGLQLHAPRHAKPYSLRLFSRTRYGNSWFEHPFFEEQGPDKFKRLILRNSGNDNVNKAPTNTHFRDPIIHTLAKQSNRNPLISESKPVNVFLNGSYHGLFNLREREDRYYIETHTGVTENYDFIELEFGYYANRHIIEGSYDAWTDLLAFVDTTGDLSLDSDYEIVNELVDLDNFTDYWITEVFVGNYDWLSNNVKFWKADTGKWQWLYWDTDHGLGLIYSGYGDVEWNTLYWSLTFSDRAWSNGYNNILIRNLLENEGYKEHFIKRFTQLLSTSFSYDKTRPLLDSMKNLYQADIGIHAGRWNRSMTDWDNAIHIVDDYLQRRPDTVLTHIQDFFGLQEPVPVSIRVEPPGAGTIFFSGLEVSTEPLKGKFFPGMNYYLKNSPVPGFLLEKWEPFQSTVDSIGFELSDSMDIVAYFLPSDQSFPIQLCEVYSNNRESYDAGDWIEFYYYGSDTLYLEDWYITGDNDQLLYTFNEDISIYPGQRFVVCEDVDRFKKVFPTPIFCYGNLIQGFSTNSILVLKSEDDEIIKSVDLMASEEWPNLPSAGFSIELKSIVADTDKGSSWEISENRFGSPGIPNYEIYNFQAPSGKDSAFSNHETHIVHLASTQDYYQDPDHHGLAGISIKDISGPGLFYLGETGVEQGNIYEPSDLVFSPQEPYSSASSLIYSFIDGSGMESADHILQFNPAVHMKQGSLDSFRVYPVPAGEYCIFEIPPDLPGSIDLYLFDLNGRILQRLHRAQPESQLHMDLSGLENGIYFYRIKTGQAVVNGKLEIIK